MTDTARTDQTQEVLAITDDLLARSRHLLDELDAQLAEREPADRHDEASAA